MTGHTTQLQNLIDLATKGDNSAWEATLQHACDRLRALASRMMRTNQRVRRWAETDDVLQNSLIRLHRSLSEVRPESPRQFYGLATTHMRRELIDLARKHFGAEGLGANHHTDGGIASDNKPNTAEPETIEAWIKFHEQVEALPDQEREVVNLLWYEEMSQPEAADVLGVSLATVKRRWQSARIRLSETLDGEAFQ
ncbi:sigma-70 family RNA polymerase sigma factor [Gimesia chilikensis]|uniref:RNA polymerase sigma factor n=1 Tax=Gimesia chilikensis TaxID=2605989 RepID=UPI0011F01D67|nr:sigma-70 family RNA polymerase sigma factor [Gimesia chilikensis]KAA0131576.1 sigma-70 family RNA polymerase sigma factor [Gimesia chilikensis]